MKLTNKVKARIAAALRNAERARAYIHNDRMAVCRRDLCATTTRHYARPDGAVLYEVERAYGSDLVGLDVCIHDLRTLLEDAERVALEGKDGKA